MDTCSYMDGVLSWVGWLAKLEWMSVESNKSFFPWDVRFLSQTYIDKCELADVWADKHEWVLGKIIRWCCSCWDFGVNIRVKLSYHQLMSRFTSTCYCCCYAFAGCHWFKKQGRRVNRLPFVRVEVWKFNRFGNLEKWYFQTFRWRLKSFRGKK